MLPSGFIKLMNKGTGNEKGDFFNNDVANGICS